MQQSRGRVRAPLAAFGAATIISAITIAATTAYAGPPVTATRPLHTAAEPSAIVKERHTAHPPAATTSRSASNATPAIHSAAPTPIVAHFPYRLSVTPAVLTSAVKAGLPVIAHGKDIVVISSNIDLVLNGAADQNIVVLGDENHITVKGACAPLLVSGSGNIVEVQKVRYIETRGKGNSVFYDSDAQEPTKSPRVVNGGKDNLILPVAYM